MCYSSTQSCDIGNEIRLMLMIRVLEVPPLTVTVIMFGTVPILVTVRNAVERPYV